MTLIDTLEFTEETFKVGIPHTTLPSLQPSPAPPIYSSVVPLNNSPLGFCSSLLRWPTTSRAPRLRRLPRPAQVTSTSLYHTCMSSWS